MLFDRPARESTCNHASSTEEQISCTIAALRAADPTAEEGVAAVAMENSSLGATDADAYAVVASSDPYGDSPPPYGACCFTAFFVSGSSSST